MPSLSLAVAPSAACPMGPWPPSSICPLPWVPSTAQGASWPRDEHHRHARGSLGSTGLHRLVGMQQSFQADREPWEASASWEYPSSERRNMEMIKLNSKHAGILLTHLAACARHAVSISPHCVQRQRVCCLSHLNLQHTEKRKGQ